MKRVLTSSAFATLILLSITIPGKSAETFCIARNAWTCEDVAGLEQLSKMRNGQPMDMQPARGRRPPGPLIPGTQVSQQELDNVVATDRCRKSEWLRSPEPNSQIMLWNKVSVMAVDNDYAYICHKSPMYMQLSPTAPAAIFVCEWASVSDVRDMNWKAVSRERLVQVASTATMADVTQPNNCPASYPH